MFLKNRFLAIILPLQLLGLTSYGQTNNPNNYNLYIESIGINDTLILKSTTWHHERIEDVEKLSIYYKNNELVADLNWRFLMSDEVKCDTLIKLDKVQIEKIKIFENAVRNQNLEGNQINFSGRFSKYELIFKEGIVMYSTMNTYYRFCDGLLK